MQQIRNNKIARMITAPSVAAILLTRLRDVQSSSVKLVQFMLNRDPYDIAVLYSILAHLEQTYDRGRSDIQGFWPLEGGNVHVRKMATPTLG